MQKEYEYRVKDLNGMSFSGIITAKSEAAVALSLRNKGYFITQIKEKKVGFLHQDITFFEKGVSTADLVVFTRQFSVMIEAGVPLLTILNILVEQTEHKRLREVLQNVQYDVQSGETLAQAMAKHPDVFPTIMVSLVEAGELGGVLDTVMARLATHLEKEHKMRQKILSAMIYPMFILFVSIIAVAVIFIIVLPKFDEIFKSVGMQLPEATQLLLSFSNFLRQHYLAIPSAMLGSIFTFSRLLAMDTVRPKLDAIKLCMPIWGNVARKVAVARFSRTLGILLHGGIMLLPALEVVKKVAGNAVLADTVSQAQISIKEGYGLATPLTGTTVFPSMVVRMIAIGEEAGELEHMLEKVAEFYEFEVENKLENLSKLIEPVLILFLALIIGFIAIAVIIPMLNISSAIMQ